MEKLRIYQAGLILIQEIYLLINKNRQLRSDYSLADQLKRAAVSVLANIAEGYGQTIKQNKRYLQIASGSANEVVALLQVVEVVYLIETGQFQEKFRVLGKQINSFSKTLKPKPTTDR